MLRVLHFQEFTLSSTQPTVAMFFANVPFVFRFLIILLCGAPLVFVFSCPIYVSQCLLTIMLTLVLDFYIFVFEQLLFVLFLAGRQGPL